MKPIYARCILVATAILAALFISYTAKPHSISSYPFPALSAEGENILLLDDTSAAVSVLDSFPSISSDGKVDIMFTSDTSSSQKQVYIRLAYIDDEKIVTSPYAQICNFRVPSDVASIRVQDLFDLEEDTAFPYTLLQFEIIFYPPNAPSQQRFSFAQIC